MGTRSCIYLKDIVTAGQIFKNSSNIALGFENGVIGIWSSEASFDKFE